MLSAEQNVKMGVLLKDITETYEKKREIVWSKILGGKKILSDKEADELEDIINKVRKEKGFR